MQFLPKVSYLHNLFLYNSRRGSLPVQSVLWKHSRSKYFSMWKQSIWAHHGFVSSGRFGLGLTVLLTALSLLASPLTWIPLLLLSFWERPQLATVWVSTRTFFMDRLDLWLHQCTWDVITGFAAQWHRQWTLLPQTSSKVLWIVLKPPVNAISHLQISHLQILLRDLIWGHRKLLLSTTVLCFQLMYNDICIKRKVECSFLGF